MHQDERILTASDNWMSTQSFQSTGVTPTEKYLAGLCGRTFLRLWSYPNPYKDQGKRSPDGDGTELCDLLVICGDDVVIFSDKACAYPQSTDPDLNWSRWYRRAVEDSLAPIRRTERWLRKHPDRLFLDRACARPLPVSIPGPDRIKIHRVIVAHGAIAGVATAPHPQLRLQPSIIGEDHYRPSAEGGLPFTIGQVDPKLGFIHVLDDEAIKGVLSELDTIADLLKYFNIKEQLVVGGYLQSAELEMDLLGHYMNRTGGPSEVFQLPPEEEKLTIAAGTWEKFVESGRRDARIVANRDSYMWDRMIDTMAKNAVDGKLLPDPRINVASVETILRSLAREPRIRRRVIVEAFREIVEAAPLTSHFERVVPPEGENEPTYILITFPRSLYAQYRVEEKYREHRQTFSYMCCMAYKATNSEARDVVGISVDPGAAVIGSEDIMFIDSATWAPEAQAFGEQMQEKFRFLTSRKRFVKLTTEYAPPSQPILTVGLPPIASLRKTCPFCDSGRRFKNCCGKKA